MNIRSNEHLEFEALAELEELTFSSGNSTFNALSAGQGECVILLHGFPDTPSSFEHQIQSISQAGYRVIAPYLRGYQPQSQGQSYLPNQAAMDVYSIIDELGEDKVHLVGHDWGACIAQAAAIMNPHRFHSLSIISVPNLGQFLKRSILYPRQLKNSWYIAFFLLPYLPERVIKRNNFQFLDNLWRAWSPGWRLPSDRLESIKRDFSQPKVVESALAYYRQTFSLFSPRSREYRKLAMKPCLVPTLGLSGIEDGCIDSWIFSSCMREQDYPNGLECSYFPGTGHFLHLEDPDSVNKTLLDWFSRNS